MVVQRVDETHGVIWPVKVHHFLLICSTACLVFLVVCWTNILGSLLADILQNVLNRMGGIVFYDIEETVFLLRRCWNICDYDTVSHMAEQEASKP